MAQLQTPLGAACQHEYLCACMLYACATHARVCLWLVIIANLDCTAVPPGERTCVVPHHVCASMAASRKLRSMS
jgi:hypothetical protein